MPVYSEDLRGKVVEYLKKGHTHREAAEIFGVSMRSINIWKKMDKEGKIFNQLWHNNPISEIFFEYLSLK